MAAPRNGRIVVSRKMSIWVGHYEPLELFCLWTKVHNFLSPIVEGVVVDEVFFQMFDMSISSGDIRDQSRKLPEIAPKFGGFLALPNFRGRDFQKLYPFYHPCLAARLEKVLWGYTH